MAVVFQHMKLYHGIIQLGNIETRGAVVPDTPEGKPYLLTAKFVHYPDCQQLILWLPEYGGRGHGNIRLIDRKKHKTLEEYLVADRLSGSVQIIWDTAAVPPGEYTVEIDHPHGGLHVLEFVKYKKTQAPPSTDSTSSTPSPPSTDSTYIVYRDGLGNILPNEDMELRGHVIQTMMDGFLRRLEYSGNFRAGTITYVEGDLRIDFYHEMGGGKVMFYIDIPTEQQWEARTKTPLSRRAEILDFLARRVQQEQAPGKRYEIRENDILFYN